MFQADSNLKTLKLDIVNNRLPAMCWLPSSNLNQLVSAHCIIDTGAKVTVIPQRYWEPLRAEIDGISCPDEFVRGIGGRDIPAKLGNLAFLGLTTRAETALPIWFENCQVKFAMDRDTRKAEQAKDKATSFQEIPFVLVGLGGGVLQKGGLCINGHDNVAHLILVQ